MCAIRILHAHLRPGEGSRRPVLWSFITRVTTVSLQGPRPLWEIFVNWDGKRFVSEDSESPDEKELALLTIPDITFWAIYDQRRGKSPSASLRR